MTDPSKDPLPPPPGSAAQASIELTPTTARTLPRGIRRVLVIGTTLFPVVALALWTLSPLGLWSSLFLAFLLELLPVLGLAQVPLEHKEPLPRVPVYLTSSVTILLLGGFSFTFGAAHPGWVEMGLGPIPLDLLVGWTLGLTLLALGVLGAFFVGRRALRIRESPLLAEILPRTRREKSIFVLVSGSAGLGEELAYRGYAVPVLAGLVGPVGAVAISSAAFGVLHAYQGWVGVVRTAVLGVILGVSFLYLGSLWPAILAHTILDLIGGLVLGEALIKE